jgi:sugar phosphate isomerase/epimerase
MMKTSFSTLACPDWSLPQTLAAASEYGYDGVELRVVSGELDLWKLPEFRSPGLASTRTAIKSQGLIVAAVGSSACFHSSDIQDRERNFDVALRMAEVAAGLDAPAIRVFGDRIQSGSSRWETGEWIADSLTRLADRLGPDGVQVWLETHGDFAAAADVGEILGQLERSEIGIIWDPANAFEQKSEMPLISALMSSRVRHVHLKDLARDPQGSARYVPTGEGEFPFDTMFASLAGIGFDGFVSFEWEKLWHPELASPEIALPQFIRWWKSREAA